MTQIENKNYQVKIDRPTDEMITGLDVQLKITADDCDFDIRTEIDFLLLSFEGRPLIPDDPTDEGVARTILKTKNMPSVSGFYRYDREHHCLLRASDSDQAYLAYARQSLLTSQSTGKTTLTIGQSTSGHLELMRIVEILCARCKAARLASMIISLNNFSKILRPIDAQLAAVAGYRAGKAAGQLLTLLANQQIWQAGHRTREGGRRAASALHGDEIERRRRTERIRDSVNQSIAAGASKMAAYRAVAISERCSEATVRRAYARAAYYLSHPAALT